MQNPFTTNYSKNDTIKWFAYMGIMILFLGGFTLIFLDSYVLPVLKGWELVSNHIFNEENGFFQQTVDSEIKTFTDGARDELVNTDWDSMSSDQMRDRLQALVVDGTRDIFTKLWGIVLVTIIPVLTLPLVFWVGYKSILFLGVRLLRMLNILPDDTRMFQIYFKGTPLFKERKNKDDVNLTDSLKKIDDTLSKQTH